MTDKAQADASQSCGQSISTDGLGVWVNTASRMPDESETIDGRVPAIDADGYLVHALLICGRLQGSSAMEIRWWMPVQAPNVEVRGER